MLDKLKELRNEENSKFMSKLINYSNPCLGLYMKDIKKIAHDNSHELAFILEKHTFQEEYLLSAFLISYIKDYKLLIEYLDYFLDYVNNWAICDSLVSSLKIIKKHKKEFKVKINEYLNSNEIYKIRFSLIVLKCYYIEDENLDYIFNIIKNIKINHYYINMAISWLLCDLLIKRFDETFNFINNNMLNSFVFKFLKQKVKDTLRLTKEEKELIINLIEEK